MAFPMLNTDRYRPINSGGYTLAGLMVVLVVLEISLAVSLPLWSAAVTRDKEEEMIFRGLQYAEAIRLFQVQNGRLPASFKEIVENQPRILRQAWINPIEEEMGWLPVMQLEGSANGLQQRQQDGQGRQGAQAGSDPRQDNSDRDRRRRRGRGQNEEEEQPEPFLGGSLEDLEDNQYGPFSGVKPGSTGESMLVYLGSEDYSEWEFAPEHLIQPPKPDGTLPTPRLWSQRFWVPLPGIEPESGEGPSGLGNNQQNLGSQNQGSQNQGELRRSRRN